MKFIVDNALFTALPNAVFGVITAYGLDNSTALASSVDLVEETSRLHRELSGQKVKEHSAVIPYREAFLKLGINPNKYLPSIEALMTRVQKSGSLPQINPLVDLVNSVSLKYQVPMGAHDIDTIKEAMMIRPALAEDTFMPFGQEIEETAEIGELVYVADHNIRTRRWIWRQSEIGKVTAATRNIFIPIDGFAGTNEDQVRAALALATTRLQHYFKGTIYTGMIDKNSPIFDDEQTLIPS
ncbi:MAG: B3/4 domain-containing protein [Methanomassiliicoccales archaeon]